RSWRTRAGLYQCRPGVALGRQHGPRGTAEGSLPGSSAHAGEVDREARDGLPLGVAHDEDGPRRPGQVLGWKPVYAAREVAAVVLPDGRALVLDEGRLDLAVVQQQPRREVTGELLARPLEIDPEHQTVLQFRQHLPLVLGLERLVLERRVARRQRQPVEG